MPPEAPPGPAPACPDDIPFDDTTRPLKRPPVACLKGVHSIARLTAEKAVSGDLVRFKTALLALRTTRTDHLILRIATTADPLMLWALHGTLDKRGIAPCLRWPKNDSTPQMVFITWLADVHWLATHNPALAARARRIVIASLGALRGAYGAGVAPGTRRSTSA